MPSVSFLYPLGAQGDIKGAADCILKPKGSHLGWTVADISPTLGFNVQRRSSGMIHNHFIEHWKRASSSWDNKGGDFFFSGSCWNTLWNPLWEALKSAFKNSSNGVRLGRDWSGRRMWGMENLQTRRNHSWSMKKTARLISFLLSTHKAGGKTKISLPEAGTHLASFTPSHWPSFIWLVPAHAHYPPTTDSLVWNLRETR